MNDEQIPISGQTATAEPVHHPADRHTDAGLGMFERVNSIVGTTGIGVASGVGGALQSPTVRDDANTITGVDDTTRFSEADDRHWRETHKATANAASNYEEYQPAYRYGTDAAHSSKGKTWDAASADLESGWDKAKGESSLTWTHVKDAARDAWHRVERAFSGNADPDVR